MARRFVYFQGSVNQDFPLKLLLEGPDGYYVGGWGEPVPIVAYSADGYSRIYLQAITATGAGTTDWIAGGWAIAGGVFSFVFYNHLGLVSSFVFGDGFALAAGHFAASVYLEDDVFYWAKPDGTNGTNTSPDFVQGFILPSVWAGLRLDIYGGFLEGYRQVAAHAPDLSYAVLRGDVRADLEPTTNPWLVTAAGTFTNLSTDLNAAIPQCDLIGLTLYEKSENFGGTAPWVEGNNTLTITPHTLTTGGAVTTGDPFPIAYVAPDPEQYFAWDASLWVAP